MHYGWKPPLPKMEDPKEILAAARAVRDGLQPGTYHANEPAKAKPKKYTYRPQKVTVGHAMYVLDRYTGDPWFRQRLEMTDAAAWGLAA